MDFYSTIANRTDAYICFHSAAQMLMYPLGNTNSTALVPNAADLKVLAETGAKALYEVNQIEYKYGNAMDTLYVTSGSSRDHAYGFYKTPLVFTYEMREGKTESIFILPKEEIIPNSKEIFVSLLAIIEKSKELNYFQVKT
jgi:Zinc carboxypeptidase